MFWKCQNFNCFITKNEKNLFHKDNNLSRRKMPMFFLSVALCMFMYIIVSLPKTSCWRADLNAEVPHSTQAWTLMSKHHITVVLCSHIAEKAVVLLRISVSLCRSVGQHGGIYLHDPQGHPRWCFLQGCTGTASRPFLTSSASNYLPCWYPKTWFKMF